MKNCVLLAGARDNDISANLSAIQATPSNLGDPVSGDPAGRAGEESPC